MRCHIFASILIATVLLLAACGGDDTGPIATAADTDRVLLDGPWLRHVAADPAAGFHHPYYLFYPGESAAGTLLVLPNNTGTTDDDPAVHDVKAAADIGRVAEHLSPRLAMPILVPTFPRPASRMTMYTHALDRDCLRERTGALGRLDLQLLAMIDHARALLDRSGHALDPRVALFGFSASGTHVNRFTVLHPERVRVVVAGGINATPILPLDELDGHTLGFPLGVEDLAELTGRPFAREAWAAVPQLIFMGADDDNDTMPYGDAWDDDERAIIKAVLGERMQPDRWERMQSLLVAAGTRITCRTYPDTGHEITPAMVDDIVAFIAEHTMDAPAP